MTILDMRNHNVLTVMTTEMVIKPNALTAVMEVWIFRFHRRKLNRQRSVFPSDTALLKALYLSTYEATKKWTMTIRNWGQVYGELSIMYEGRLPE